MYVIGGGANEQFTGAVKYSQSIQKLDGTGIHEENGMYLWLNEMYLHPADETSIMEDVGFPEMAVGDGANGPIFVPPYSVCRSGTIPHGTTINLLGKAEKCIDKTPEFPSGTEAWQPEYLSISPSMGLAGTKKSDPINLDEPAPEWVHDKALPEQEPSSNRAYTQRILANKHYPYSVRPDLRLRDAIKDQCISEYTLIEMSSRFEGGPQGGIINTPFVQKHSPVTEMRTRMWIETVVENGKEILQLQYEQIQFFEFQFGEDGGTTRWPHIQINTLRKKG
ncbi:peroxidase, FMP-type [Photobacterium minamisatsumaniensis]|uniref:peroxidase, FMP-type n=1 Tax=Photobacterium minamisatsumaniensis TaxID=2910233 RepID=UPI003D133F97